MPRRLSSGGRNFGEADMLHAMRWTSGRRREAEKGVAPQEAQLPSGKERSDVGVICSESFVPNKLCQRQEEHI